MEPVISTLTLWATDKCNLDCQYCYVKKNNRAMSFDTARKAIDFIHKQPGFNRRTLGLQFFGGEPLLALDLIKEVVDYCSYLRRKEGKSFGFAFTTNGTLLDDENLKFLRKNDFNLMISLDGPEEVHNRRRSFTDGTGTYNIVIKGFKKAKQYLKHVDIRMTIHPDEMDIANNISHLAQLAPRQIVMAPVQQADWSEPIKSGRLLKEFKKMADMIIREIQKRRIPPIITFLTVLNLYAYSQVDKINFSRPCGAGTTLIAVTQDGNILPCHHWFSRKDWWMGDIYNGIDPEKRKVFLEITKSQFPYCKECEADNACWGPCMASSVDYAGGLFCQHEITCAFSRYLVKAAKYVHSTLILEGNYFFRHLLSKKPTELLSEGRIQLLGNYI